MAHPLKVTHCKLGGDEAVNTGIGISDEEVDQEVAVKVEKGAFGNPEFDDPALRVTLIADSVAQRIVGRHSQEAARLTRWNEGSLAIHQTDPLYKAIRASVERQLKAAAVVQSQ